MRDVWFKVKKTDGTEVMIRSASEAAATGKIVETVLTTSDEKSEKQKAYEREHCKKIYERFGIK